MKGPKKRITTTCKVSSISSLTGLQESKKTEVGKSRIDNSRIEGNKEKIVGTHRIGKRKKKRKRGKSSLIKKREVRPENEKSQTREKLEQSNEERGEKKEEKKQLASSWGFSLRKMSHKSKKVSRKREGSGNASIYN